MKRDNLYLRGNKFAAGQQPNKTSFRPGQTPWNKGLKGWQAGGRSIETQFKKGQLGHKHRRIGSKSIRKDKGKGQKRMYIKIAEPNIWKLRSVIVWEQVCGPIPKGFVLHHKDHDSLNDAVGNLCLLTRGEHLKEHEKELRLAAKKSPKRMGWGPGGKRVRWRQSWMGLEQRKITT